MEILESECSEEKLGCEGWGTTGMDRIWFSILKLGDGNPDLLLEAVKLARTDWRDLLMAAGFGNDIHAHEKWWQQITR